jgi:hypothetical protein
VSTSGSYNFTVQRDVLIKDALIDLGAVAQEDTVSSAVNEHASRQLNLMLKALQAKGLRMWKSRNATLLLQQGTRSYNLGPSGDHFFLDSELIETEVKTAITGAGGSNVAIDVDLTTGMVAGDVIGIELDDGSMHFTTIQSVTDSDTLRLTAGVPTGDTAAVDNNIYTYTNKAQQPLQIVYAAIRDDSNYDRPLRIVSRDEYLRFGDKFTQGSITSIYYDPQLTNNVLYVYPPETETVNTMKLVVQYPIEDMDAAANDFDCPPYWLMAIKYQLELVLAPAFGARSEQIKTIAALAESYLDDAMGFDKENETSLYFQPEWYGQGM